MSSPTKEFRLGVAFALINLISLGILGIIDKLGALNTVTPIFFSTQSVIASLFFSMFFALLYRKKSFIKDLRIVQPSTWKLIILVGLFAGGIAISFRILGLTQSTGTFATLSQIFITSLTAIFAMVFLREKLTGKFWILFLIMIVATYFVSIGQITLSPLSLGDSYILLGGVFIAFANIFSRKALYQTSPLVVAFGRPLIGGVFLLLISSLFFPNPKELLNISIWALLSGLFWTIGITCYFFAMQKLGVTLATSILMIAPVVTMVLEYLFLKQLFTPVQVIAAFVVIISGILMVTIKSK